jgi:hypothetical protein
MAFEQLVIQKPKKSPKATLEEGTMTVLFEKIDLI